MRILVVDPDEGSRRALAASLLEHFLRVELACNSLEAVDRMERERFAVVLLDDSVVRSEPTFTGRFSTRDLSSPVVIVISAQTDESLDPVGVHGVMHRPFDPDELARTVLACLEVRSVRFDTMALAALASGSLVTLLSLKV